MGKKSKRKNILSSSSKNTTVKKDSNTTLIDESPDNLRFEDPFEDEFEPEDAFVTTNGKISLDHEDDNFQNSSTDGVQAWNPLTSSIEPGTKLEVDEAAYKMHHSLTPEWPALSFDFIKDNLGLSRTRFPHSMIAVVGSQADRADRNKLTIMKFSDLCRTGDRCKSEKELEDEILGEEIRKDGDNDDDDDDHSDDDIHDSDPVLEHYNLRHVGGINRVRVMPQRSEVVATWSDTGTVNIYNIKGILDSFDRSAGSDYIPSRRFSRDPFFVYQGHSSEGYAMDWSNLIEGQLATGDCDGHIHLWKASEGYTNFSNSSFQVNDVYGPSGDNIDNPSIEDIQWSPNEQTVLASAECGGFIKIYDTRSPGRPVISRKIHENNVDVNVISWNPKRNNLLASGGDDGLFSVWDLRCFQLEDGPQPLARFTCHKKPITSLQWHPSDESMIVVSDEDATYIYDLSIEEDEEEGENTSNIPSQLLFVHCGSQSTKEARWHPQISSLVMTTAYSGYSMFIPSNL